MTGQAALIAEAPVATQTLSALERGFKAGLSTVRSVIAYMFLSIAILVLWQYLSDIGAIKPMLLPAPTKVAATLMTMLINGELLSHLGISLLRVLEGFALAAVIGLPLGIGIGLSRALEHLTDLILQLMKPIPPIAWIPLSILWFGIGEGGKVFIIFLGAVFPILINTVDGIRQTDQRFVEVARVLEVTRPRFILKVVLPGALPAIMTGLRIGLMVAWICVVAAELIASSSGLGYLIMDARQLMQTDRMLVGMLTIGVMGKFLDVALKAAEHRLITWKTSFAGH